LYEVKQYLDKPVTMKEDKILVPVDFTSVNEKSLAYAAMIAKKGDMTITLLHIDTGKSDRKSEDQLLDFTARVKLNIICSATTLSGKEVFSQK